MRGAKSATMVIGAIAIALTATACGGGSSSGGAEDGVVRAWWGDPQNPLEPANTNETNGGKVLDMIFSDLKEYNPKDGQAQNASAESITSSDQQTFTIKLKPGLKFSDGTPVTANSFVDAWNYGALLTNAQKDASFFSNIEGFDQVHPDKGQPTAKTMSGLKVVDNLTFTVKLTQKFSSWPDSLGYDAFAPLPKSFFSDHAKWLQQPVGNGPYKIESYTKGQSMKLVPNPYYTGDEKPKNKGVLLKVYTDENTAYADLQAGNLDVYEYVPASDISHAKSDMAGRYFNAPTGINQTISFPLNQKSWGASGMNKVRQGISMAIDRDSITKKIFQGTRTPATDFTSQVLGSAGGYSTDVCGDYCKYDPAKAKELIKEGGGIPGGKFTISYNADSGSHKEWVDAVCNSINNALGGQVCLGNPVGTFADFRNQITQKQMINPFRAGWQMDYPLIDDFLQPLYTTDASSNDSHYSNPDFDKLISQAESEPDKAKSVALYQQAEKLLVNDMPAIPLWYQNTPVVWSSRVSNVTVNPFSYPVYYNITVKG
ncbi:ABC transporter substrate-binding protein [Streptantibioticus rubrisoli]|uniref:ABC transporter substrate-binding protein n=1 Tax=Streptantibioticus rubrisoli TaxID=1387313 RepID=A0ABT1PF78_9ACTN|nr:ABC transporter substrate-binding protein [Streptantibioticus rubrisoli]MCQ4044017.1 ABC transporter substrate-binding protein [Streptantibioticus rubrisoli]